MIESLHLLSTVYMTGLIWFVQRVHYPMYADVGSGHFARYEAAHNRRTGYVVIPAMLTELATAILLFARQPIPLHLAGLVLIAVIWFSTFALQVPCHKRLLAGFDATTHRLLVHTNWIRTLAWTARALMFTLPPAIPAA